jgi:hypothetical protein
MTVTASWWEGHVACTGETKLLVRKPEGKRQLGIPKHRWVVHIRFILNKHGWWDVDCIHLAQDRIWYWDCVNTAMNYRPITWDAYFVLINMCSIESVISLTIKKRSTYSWVKMSENVTTCKCETDVKIILKWEINVGWFWIVIDVDMITTMLNIQIPVQKLGSFQRLVGKHVLSMKATSFRDDEPRLVSHCQNLKARIYPCERIQKRRITRLTNLFQYTSWLSSCLARLQL